MTKKKVRPAWRVLVIYDGYDQSFDRRIETLAGRESGGSGCGFGERDIDFYFAKKDAAFRAAKRIRRLRTHGRYGNNLKARVYKPDTEDEE